MSGEPPKAVKDMTAAEYRAAKAKLLRDDDAERRKAEDAADMARIAAKYPPPAK